MASYQRVQYEATEYANSGGQCHSWSSDHSGAYANASGYSYGAGLPARTAVNGTSEMYRKSSSTEGRCGGDPFCALVPSSFPPGTDPKFVDCFNRMDKDRSGQICDQELQSALSSFDQKFSLRTVHLLMYMFTGSSSKVIGPKEFVPLVRSLQTWKMSFQSYDRTRNGRLEEREVKDALMSMGYNVSPFVLKLLMSKFDKSGAKWAIEYDYFIECCVVVKGLTDKFRGKEDPCSGTATFTCDELLLNVLPFIVA